MRHVQMMARVRVMSVAWTVQALTSTPALGLG